jgi:hypothetical protein
VHRRSSIGVYVSADGCHRSINNLPTDAITSPHPP